MVTFYQLSEIDTTKLAKLLFIFGITVLSSYSIYTLYRGVGGFDYNIYNYYSQLYFQGLNPYYAPNVEIRDNKELYMLPEYLDYTGTQLFIYNICYYTKERFGIDGFILYSILLFYLSLIFAHKLYGIQAISLQEYGYLLLLILSPYLWYVLFISSYEDKAIYILIPLLSVYTQIKSPYINCFALGLFTGLVGVTGAIFPLVIFKILLHDKGDINIRFKNIFVSSAMMGLGVFISTIPFFPDSLIGWQRRAALESAYPMEFSFWNLFRDLYFPNLNKIVMLILCVLIYLFYSIKFFDFKMAILLLISVLFTFSATMGAQRIIPLVAVFVVGFRHPRVRSAYFLASFIVLFLLLLVDRFGLFLKIYHYDIPIKVKSFLLSSPMLFGYCLAVVDNLDRLLKRKQIHVLFRP